MCSYPTAVSEKPGLHPNVEHEIRITPDFRPNRLKAYRVPWLLKPEVDRQVKEMLDLGIIRPSTSEMVITIICALKGPTDEDGVGLAGDFRYINKHSKGAAFPMPDVHGVLQKLDRANFMSTFDASSG